MTEFETMKSGLTTEEATKRLQQFGKNECISHKEDVFFLKALHIICEPMFLLLIIAEVTYFVLGEPRDGAIMLIFVVAMISIDVIQEWKTDKTLSALKDLSAPQITVIRDGKEQIIDSTNLVPGDLMLICEGVKIPCDGRILSCSDLAVNESSLTGEAEAVWKDETSHLQDGYWRKDYCYAGTLVTQGSGYVLVERTGKETEYGKIGVNVAMAPDELTPLQKQTKSLVKLCAVIALVLLTLVGAFTFINLAGYDFKERIIESVLSGVTLAMAMIPEEFPVILTVFLSMGAWRLAKKHSLIRKLPSVETLGAVSVLCVDKTGTITKNEMTVQEVWPYNQKEEQLCEIMGLGCEISTYDPMEYAMLSYCETKGLTKEYLFSGTLVNEYAFTNELKMMGHIWNRDGQLILAAKGSSEGILSICELTQEQKEEVQQKVDEMSNKGLRVICVATSKLASLDDAPAQITECHLTLCGLVGLSDPPREHVKEDIERCHRAGIRVVMITGDNGITAASIARQIGMTNNNQMITGDMIDQMSDEQLCQKVKQVSIFSRVIPEHKMRIVKAFKGNGEIVAMTGDGVNDAPALKYADIGIAMGKRGSEVSREAAVLVLLDDNFTTIVETVKDGRRIYDNIRKAVGYIFTIHIPIAFASLLAPMFGFAPTALLLLPLHIVLLELIIDPTCSIVLERQPAELDIMDRKPRNPKEKLLTKQLLLKSIIQGIVVFAASFGSYAFLLQDNMSNAPTARAVGLAIIMLSNLFLVQVNSSERDYAFCSMKRLAQDKVMWFTCLGTLLMLAIILFSPLHIVLKLNPLSYVQILYVVGVSVAAVFWYDIVKLIKKR